MAKRKRFFQKRQTVDSKPADTEKVSENIQPTQDDIVKEYEKKKEIENKKTGDTSTFSFKPAGIIKYVYLIVFFAFLAGIMAPIVDPLETGATFVDSYKGIGILFVGLAGGILIFKSTKSIQNRMTFLMIGFALLIICSVFIAEFSGKSFFSTFFE
tara:strand:- start:124 stop:591 length:468 start_codon:yes stop_codon:yes gene_type:complete